MSTLNDPASQFAGSADDKGLRRVAVPAVDNAGAIDVDDVTVLEDQRSGNAVANDVVDARAATFGIGGVLLAAIAERGALVPVRGREAGQLLAGT